jgi:ABC-2 type transport system ATP-binding protein
MILLQPKNVTKRFAGHTALTNVTIDVPEGSIFGLLGPNGAGKTTLIRIINQITAPDEGKILYKSRPMVRTDIHDIGYLPEERGLYKKMKVGEQALYLARLKGMSLQDAKRELKAWFEKFELGNWWNRKVEELSKGMQQKVQFIVTVVHKPSLLIFDEPFSGFDPINVNLLKKEILKLKSEGATIIFSTHNMESVEELCDHIALINKSKTILKGDMQTIKRDFTNNTFEISYTGKNSLTGLINPPFLIVEQGMENGYQSAKIQILDSSPANELLNLLMSEIHIHSFREVLPTMNDIFISKVNEDHS